MSTLPIAVKLGLWALGIWAFCSNLWAFSLMGVDKGRARKGKRRIPEKRLFLTAAIGGALGALLGMHHFHHKTLHRAFTLGIPALLFVNLFVYSALTYLLLRT
ncbi:MAG: DUF1294 domain-containing protein [Clostridia bacterium]|nr:DUF1294 domain-containing protein [Clostridia bacterium]